MFISYTTLNIIWRISRQKVENASHPAKSAGVKSRGRIAAGAVVQPSPSNWRYQAHRDNVAMVYEAENQLLMKCRV
jgi:hypothetical protein